MNFAVALIVLAVAAGMFVLSYSGVRALAVQAGVSTDLARFYPGLFDAVLVIGCVAAVVLRDGRWWARCWAWLVIIVLLGAIGATDVAHAVNYALPHRQTEAAVAAAPLVAVLLAFSLLLTMLRQSRGQAAVQHPPTVPVLALPPAAEEHPPTLPVPALPPAAVADVEPDEISPKDETPAEDQPPDAALAPAIDEDAAPFVTAPFATVPRLNRVRATPTPPGDDEED